MDNISVSLTSKMFGKEKKRKGDIGRFIQFLTVSFTFPFIHLADDFIQAISNELTGTVHLDQLRMECLAQGHTSGGVPRWSPFGHKAAVLLTAHQVTTTNNKYVSIDLE